MGPSPRVRGKRMSARLTAPGIGSIPARAGETPWASALTANRGVHPRACGGNAREMNEKVLAEGPSPRVRGKLETIEQRGLRLRSIPARAGETTPKTW